MKEVLETIIKNLVDNQESIKIEEVEDEKNIIFKVQVADGDMGKILYHSTARIIAHFISPDIFVIMIVYAHIPEECVSAQPHRLSGKMKDESKLQHRKNGCKQPQ